MKVVMPCWIVNEELLQLTENAVNSIRLGGKVELIIIDNGSIMGGGKLRELADIYIRNKENLGYAKAVNQGLKLCDTDELVCISNNDIRVPENWMSVSLQIMQDKTVGSLHFRMVPYIQPFNCGNDTWVGGKERWCTNSFFVTRNVVFFDENFLNSYDDWSRNKDLRMMGYKQAYTNKSEYQHMDSSTQQFIPSRNDNDKKNREYFKKKYGTYPEDGFEEEFPGALAKPWKPMP